MMNWGCMDAVSTDGGRWWKSYPGRGRGVSARMGGDNVLIAGWRERVDDR